MALERDVMIAALVAAFVGVLVGAIMMITFLTILRRHRQHKLPDFAFISTPTRAKSSAGWRSPASQSIVSQPSSTLGKTISEPMLLTNFEGKGVTLPPHISEMLGIYSKQTCPKMPPLSISPTTTLQELSPEPGSDEANRQSGVPMLLRQPRKSVRSSRRGVGSIHSISSAESKYSEASAPSYMRRMPVTAAPNVPPESSLILSAHGGRVLAKTEQPVSYCEALAFSTVIMAGASTGAFDQPSMENSYDISSQHQFNNTVQVPTDYMLHSRESASPLPALPPRSPLRCKSVPNLK